MPSPLHLRPSTARPSTARPSTDSTHTSRTLATRRPLRRSSRVVAGALTLGLLLNLLVGLGGVPAVAVPLVRSQSSTYDISSGPGGSNVIFDAAVATDGSSVVVGQFEGELVLGSGAAALTLDATESTGFVARFDAADQVLWARTFSGAATGVAIDGTGAIGVTGSFSGTASFGGAVDLTAAGDADAFLARFQPDGTLDWAVQAGGTTTGSVPFGCEQPRDIGFSVAFGPGGTLSMAGGVSGTSVAFTGTGGTSVTSSSAADNVNGFVARYSATGALEQVVQVASADDSLLTGVRPAPDGGVAVVGFVRGTGTVGGTTIAATGGTDAFVALLDAAGDTEWIATIGGSAAARPVSPVCGPGQFTDASWPTDFGAGLDVRDGAIVVLAEVVGTVTVGDPGGTDPVVLAGDAATDRDSAIARYALDGTLQWAARATSPSDMLSGAVIATPAGGAISTGYFRDTATFGADVLTGVGETTMFVAGYGADGAALWADAVDGSADGYSVGFGLALTGAGGVIAVGKGAGVDLAAASGIAADAGAPLVTRVAAMTVATPPPPERAFRILYATSTGDTDDPLGSGPAAPGGTLPSVGTGEGEWVKADGTTVPLTASSPGPRQVRYSAPGVTITLTGTAATSVANGLVTDRDGEILCEVCMQLAAGGVIESWMLSTPRLVAAHRIDALPCQTFAIPNGAPLDGAGPVASGTHVLQLLMPASGTQTVNIGVTVSGPVPTQVPAGDAVTSGAHEWLSLAVGVVTLAMGALSLLLRRWLRRTGRTVAAG